MSAVFLDSSRKRKLYFRFLAVAFAAFLFFGLGLLISTIFFGSSVRPPLTYVQAAEAYHYYYSPANKKKIALTFDDGPRPKVSEALMDALERNHAPATFFYVGENMLLNPNIVKEASDRGFTIGNHSFTHSQRVQSTENRLSFELHSTEYLISHITGKKATYYRPPFLIGIGIDPTMNPYVAPESDIVWIMQNGYNPVGSDIDPIDWLAVTNEGVVAKVGEALQKSPNGHIILLHEEKNTAEAIDDIVITLRNAGYTIVSLDELLTPPSQITITRTLSLGDTDEKTNGEVTQLQWFLYKDGELDPYLITGSFGSATQAALLQFQLKNAIVNGASAIGSAGSTDSRTREVLHNRSLSVLAPVVVPSPTFQTQHIPEWIGRLTQNLYVYFFPRVQGTLTLVIKIALYLVIFRCIVLVSFIFYGKFKARKKSDHEDQFRHKNQGISVLIPAYNEQENIRATIESILRSRHERKEVIVIDDGSTDKTGDVVKEVIAANPTYPLRLIQVENGGKSSALNHGMHGAKYPVCAVLDADAVLEPMALSYFAHHFSDPKVAAVAGRVCTTNSRYSLDMFQKLEYAIGQNIDKRALSVFGVVGVVPGPAGAWSKAHVLEAGGFSNDTLVEDQDMTLTLLRMGKKIAYEERAVAYTETPHSVKNFLKQRFRWVYGTMQCFWKHKGVIIERPFSGMTLIVMPNIFVFNIFLPVTYPFADSALIFGILLSDWQGLVLPFFLFTMFDIFYAALGIWREPERWRLFCYVPIQRVVYRQLLYYSVIRGIIRAIEGTGSGWNKFAKSGETQRFYFQAVSAVPAGTTSAPIILGESHTTARGDAEALPIAKTTEENMLSPILASQLNISETTISSQQSSGEMSEAAQSSYALSTSMDPNNNALEVSTNTI